MTEEWKKIRVGVKAVVATIEAHGGVPVSHSGVSWLRDVLKPGRVAVVLTIAEAEAVHAAAAQEPGDRRWSAFDRGFHKLEESIRMAGGFRPVRE